MLAFCGVVCLLTEVGLLTQCGWIRRPRSAVRSCLGLFANGYREAGPRIQASDEFWSLACVQRYAVLRGCYVGPARYVQRLSLTAVC
jgi:hypothetical protein